MLYHKLTIQQQLKLTLREWRKLQEELADNDLHKTKQLEQTIDQVFLPQSTPKLRPSPHALEEKIRLNRKMIWQLSKFLRTSHLHPIFALCVPNKNSNTINAKLQRQHQLVDHAFQQLKAEKIRHLQHVGAEAVLARQHHDPKLNHSHHVTSPKHDESKLTHSRNH